MLHFDPEPHRYTLDGRELPSVTQVLEDVGIIDYRSIPNETREIALHRGSCVHLATAFDDEHFFGHNPQPLDESTVSSEHMPYVEAWRRFRAEKKFRAELIEHRSYHPKWGFAGTLDRTGTFENNPTMHVILDIKSGGSEPWVKYQLAAYSSFFDHPRAFLRLCCELHNDGSYRLHSFHAKDWQADFNIFTYALMIYRAKREGRSYP